MNDIVFHAMVGSLGYDSHTACAAARAGLTRTSDLPFLVLGNDGEPARATGHTASAVTKGFQGPARLARLLQGPMRALLERLPGKLLSKHQVGFYLALPPADRLRTGTDRISDPEAQESYEAETLTEPTGRSPEARAKDLVQLLTLAEDISIAFDHLRASDAGSVGFAELLSRATQDQANGLVDVAIVACVDSLCGERELRWLATTGRLKFDGQPVGLAPGEASALCVLANPRVARDLPLEAQGSVVVGAPTRSVHALSDGETPDGEVLAQLLELATDNPAWVLVDQNGEECRANEWGHALTRVRGRQPHLADANVWYPATAFGDTGVAAAGVSTCMALRAFARRYAPARSALVLSCGDGRERAGHIIRAEGEE